MSKLFKSLKKGLEEALAHTEGTITLKSEIIEIPEPPVEYSAKDIKLENKIITHRKSLQKF